MHAFPLLASVSSRVTHRNACGWYAHQKVYCISKGKIRHAYEHRVEGGTTATLQDNLIMGVRTFASNPYDGRTLDEQMGQAIHSAFLG